MFALFECSPVCDRSRSFYSFTLTLYRDLSKPSYNLSIFSHFSQYSTKPSPTVLRSLKRAIQYCKENCSSIQFKAVKNPAIKIYSDAAYNSAQYSGRTGYEVRIVEEDELMHDSKNDMNLVDWKSKKQKEKFVSTTSIEMRALRDALKNAPFISTVIKRLWKTTPKISIAIDNEPLRHQLVSKRCNAEPKRQGELEYILQEIDDQNAAVHLVPTERMIADRMTKFKHFGTPS